MLFCRETMETATLEATEAVSQLRVEMREGLTRGEAQRKLTERVFGIFADPMRAFRIATTESSRAMHSGQLMSARASGVVQKKEWLASPDACPRCLELNGVQKNLDEPFWVDSKGGPYAVVMHPPLHPHCFCDQTDVL
jgi:hypothetical protein